MTRVITLVLLFTLAIVFHGQIETASQNVGLSFTLSKMMPYVLQAVFLIILLIESYRHLLDRFSNTLRRVIGLLILAVGGGIAFAVHPISQGDFQHEYKPVYFKGNSLNDLNDGLTMIALPGCPYCYERVEDLNRFVELYPNQEVFIQVVNQDSLALEEYQERTSDAIHVSLVKNEPSVKLLIGERYPSFIFISSGNHQGMIWNNNGFGVAALDFILEQ